MRQPDACHKAGEVVGGRYRVESVIGTGGMGVVYKATHVGLNQQVALKVLWPAVATDREAVARFEREAQIAGRLTSEHAARVTDVGQDGDEAPFLVMEYLSGSNLADVLRERGTLPIHEVSGWILEACEGLAEAHSLGIVHRDIKPANLFLARRANGTSVVKVLDFGISKLLPTGLLEERGGSLTATEVIMGSPRYMSPEQVRSAKHVDLRADIWSLGVTLYELTGGALPFSGESSFELLVSIVSQAPPPLSSLRPEIPPAFERMVARCLEKSPEKRFAHVGELADALAPFCSGERAAMLPRIKAFSGISPEAPPDAAHDLGLADTATGTPAPRPSSGLSTSSPSLAAPAGRPWPAALVAGGALLALGAWRLGGPPAREGADSSSAASASAPAAARAAISSAPSAPPPARSEATPSSPAASSPAPSSSAPVASASARVSPSPRLPPRTPTGPAKSSIRDESRK